jgi:hypothetical protein
MTIVPMLLMLLVGVPLANAAGLQSRGRLGVVLALGPAYLLGTAATAIVAIALLVVGVPVLPAFGLALAVVAAAGAFASSRAAPRQELGLRLTAPLAVALVLLAAFALLGAFVAASHPLQVWDAWSIYGRKAVSLHDSGGLDGTFFSDPANAIMHPDYPLLLPLLESVRMKFGAATNGAGTALLTWSLLVAYGWTLVCLLLPLTRWAVVPVIAFVLVPGVYQQALSGYADLPMAVFIGAGLVFTAAWLRTGSRKMLAAAALLLAAAACTKNEGVLAAAVVLFAAALVSGAVEGRRSREPLLALACVAVAVLPWHIWTARHGLHGDVPFSDGLSPSYLADRTARAGAATSSLVRQAFGPNWPLVLPTGIALALAAVAVRRLRALAVLHLLAGIGFFAVLVWIYWVSHNPIGWYLATSANRTVTVLAFIAMSAVVNLLATERVPQDRASGGAA